MLEKKLIIWRGPPPADLAKHPKVLTELTEQGQADVVVVDSLKDAALGLSEDEVGAGWNRAAQELLATGRNLIVLHHLKKQTKNTKAKTGLDDVYGSTWLTSGMGSVILLDGNPGDPIVEFRHLKFPVSEVGPMRVSIDHPSGLMTVESEVDLVARARAEGSITAQHAAELLYGRADRSSVEKGRRRLEKDVVAGKLKKQNEGRSIVYLPSFGPSPSAMRHV
jgi:replicative DNA helicase